MDIIKFPSSPCLTGNMDKIIVSTPYEISFVLSVASQQIVEHSYKPNADNLIEIDVKSIVTPLLTFTLNNSTVPYTQPQIMRTFTVSIAEIINGYKSTATTRSFTALRAGIDQLSDSPANFLKANFLTWQPNLKGVTYYSPEFLTYYAATTATVKFTPYTAAGEKATVPGDFVAGPTKTLATLTTGSVWTIPVSYSVIAAALGISATVPGSFAVGQNPLPSFYDIWIEDSSGNRLTYIQRYYAENMKSTNEEWVLFENSLGGIDTFRAYGDSENTAEHTHNIVEIDDDSTEYRVDTERTHNKNTGYLDKKERLWLLDFFPSLGKYIYVGQHLRRIVVTESDVTYTAKELPSSYTFKYKYADARPYLNIPRTDSPQEVLTLTTPDLGSFTIAPRLVEFPRQSLSGGALIPVQDPYSEGWAATTMDAVKDFILSGIQEGYTGDGGIGHTHTNLSVLRALQLMNGYLTANGDKIKAGYADKAGDLADDSALYKKFLRKDIADTAADLITFLKGLIAEKTITAKGGIQIGEYVTGLLGKGGMIDKDGHGELRSLKLWEWLEVPEIRFNRISVNIGLSIKSEGGGIIEDVVTDTDDDGNPLPMGGAWLKLEDGEFGAVAFGDLCMGLWHDLGGGNAAETTDDKKGAVSIRGFKTVYFRITDIPETDPDGKSNSDQHFFRYALRSIEEGGNLCHPCAQMHFAQRGNTEDEERQTFTFSTTKYSISLDGVNTWEFQDSQIYKIEGDLRGFSMQQIGSDGKTYTKHFERKGLAFGNAYVFGKIDEFERAGYRLEITRSNDGRITSSSPDKVTVRVLNGYGADVSSKFSAYKLTRDSGDPEADAEWNKQHQSVGNEFTIAALALGTMAYIQPILFTITASGEGVSDVSASFTERLVSTEQLHIEFQPIEGKSYVVKASNVDTIVEARLFYGSEDITDTILLRSTTQMKWTRDSGIPTEDAAWTATTGETPNIIHIIDRINDRHDCGSYWSEKLKVLFTFECSVIFAEDEVTMEASLGLGN